MLYRNKKENDLNEGKWIGVGGKFEEKESPMEDPPKKGEYQLYTDSSYYTLF